MQATVVILNISGHALVKIVEKLRAQHSRTGCGLGPTLHVNLFVPHDDLEGVVLENCRTNYTMEIYKIRKQFQQMLY